MRLGGYPLTHLPAIAMLGVNAFLRRFRVQAQLIFPSLLGLPTLGSHVQLYRNDRLFKTQISVFNYYSTFYPEYEVRLEYQLEAFNRHGESLGVGQITLPAGGGARVSLSDVIQAKLDEYGLFTVDAKPVTEHSRQVRRLGVTASQFMTLFSPSDQRLQAPQIIHSHKLFQSFWLPKSQIIRNTSISEDLVGRTLTEFYFLNPCPLNTDAVLHILDGETGSHLTQRSLSIPGHGVGQVSLFTSDFSDLRGLLGFKYEFSRRISHMKPIIFRHQSHGVVTCNHS